MSCAHLQLPGCWQFRLKPNPVTFTIAFGGTLISPEDQDLFEQARKEWASLNHDAFLFHAIGKVGLTFASATAGSALNWTQVKMVAARTPGGRVGIYGIQLLKFAAIPVGILAAFYYPWWRAIAIGLGWLLVFAFVFDIPVTRRSVARGAASDLDAFDELWGMGAIALIDSEGRVFAFNRANPIRWQDTVLRRLGWTEHIFEYPKSREEAIDAILAKPGAVR